MQKKDTKEKRILCCGDIHGAYRALLQVLERCEYDQYTDQLIFLGDYVDGWSESPQLIEHLQHIFNISTHKPFFLLGNHDQWCKDWIMYEMPNVHWMNNGGASTVEAYQQWGDKDEHLFFFKGLHNYYVDDQNRGFVHGGYVSRKGLGHEAHQSNYYWDRDLWQLAVMLHGKTEQARTIVKTDDKGNQFMDYNPYGTRFFKHKEIFLGHTSTNNWNCKAYYPEWDDPNQKQNAPITVPMNRCNVWNIDTGAGWGGKLTIMDVDTKEYWQSDLVSELYPDEKGRH